MVKLFGEKRETLLEFLTSIIFEGPMASAIKAETIQTIGSVALDITPEGLVTCSMLDSVTRENIYVNVSLPASIPGEIKEKTTIAFLDATLIKGIISNYPSGSTIFLSLSEEGDSVEFADQDETMLINEATIDPESIPGNEKAIIETIKFEGMPSIAGKEFNAKFNISFVSLRNIEKMNKTLDTPHVSVRFSGKEIFVISGDINKKRTNLFKASATEISKLEGGAFVAGELNVENKYPIGIIPLIKSLDEAVGYARITGESRLEQLLFIGNRNGIKKVYMIGASAKTD